MMRRIHQNLLHQGKSAKENTSKPSPSRKESVEENTSKLSTSRKESAKEINKILLLQKVVLRTRLKELVKQIVTPTIQI